MNQYLKTVILLAAIIVAGCKDDESLPDQPAINDTTFTGSANHFVLGPETQDFHSSDFTLVMLAPDNTLISRRGHHIRAGKESQLYLDKGLCDGTFRLLYLEYATNENPQLQDLASEFPSTQYGLGSRILIKDGRVSVIDHYDEEMGLAGSGTEDDPYQITSYHNLIRLSQVVNSAERNGLVTADTHFSQVGKIDMYQASREIDRRYGWLPIGANSALPFRGHYHGGPISTLIADRGNSAGIGLFGYVHNATFYNVQMTNSAVAGNFAAAALVGASLEGGHDRGIVSFIDCSVSGCEITGSDSSVAVGSLLGAIDMHSQALFHNCISSDNTISASYNAGGLAGAGGLYSSISFSNCSNTSAVSASYSGAGGLIGSCDTLVATSCTNAGVIKGAISYRASDTGNSGIGSGGIAGGTGAATITSCINQADISGYAGVGGISGSSRIKGSDTEAYMYNNIVLRYCRNDGGVSGTDCVGGLIGEGQAGTFAAYNTGHVSGVRYVAGVAGCTSLAVVHNAVNTGRVDGRDYVAGIVGKTQFGSIAINHNYGSVESTGTHLGGIVALAGNNTIVHYCGNFGNLASSGNGPAGGIVGEIGDPREWTGMAIAECVIGSAEIVMAFAGPVLAICEHPIATASETLATFLHVAEVASDSGLLIADAVILGMCVEEMLGGEEAEEIKAEVGESSREVNNEIMQQMAAVRNGFLPDTNPFDPMAITTGYNSQVENLLAYCMTEEGNTSFSEQINLTREERAGYLERIHKTNEIIHQAVSGVCILVGSVATIGGIVASGGAAAPFVIAGSMASLAGGLNAITKSCMEFEENAVFVSQCVNAGDIAGTNGYIGGLVGVLEDNSVMRDCLNIADGHGRGLPFAAHSGDNVILSRMLSLGRFDTWGSVSGIHGSTGCAIYAPTADSYDQKDAKLKNVHLMNDQDVANPRFYLDIDESWNIGKSPTDLWQFGSGASNTFPITGWSEMRK